MRRWALLAALVLAPASVRASCFDGQMTQAAWSAAAASSTLRLVAMRADGKALGSASGVVVAGSGAPARVLTAGQVARDAAGGWIAAWSSSGAYLGRLERAAESAPRPVARLSARAMPPGVRGGDIAVLRMAQSSADGARLYAAIPGLPLAPRQPAGLLTADVTDPGGVDAGASGAGVIGADGRLLGVLLARAAGRATPRVDVRAGLRTVRLPLRALAFAMPLADPAVLAALGPAGAGIAQARAAPQQPATILGYAGGGCVVFRAAMGPA